MDEEHPGYRVCVVEPQMVFRNAWRTIVAGLHLDLTAVARSIDELPRVPCDVVVIDADGHDEPCAVLIRRVRARLGDVPVCAVAQRATLDLLSCRMHENVICVLKTASNHSLRRAIREAARRRIPQRLPAGAA
jgi:DNA-binding NarL/FixJ family response regulator